jgi:hypothetical protein
MAPWACLLPGAGRQLDKGETGARVLPGTVQGSLEFPKEFVSVKNLMLLKIGLAPQKETPEKSKPMSTSL